MTKYSELTPEQQARYDERQKQKVGFGGGMVRGFKDIGQGAVQNYYGAMEQADIGEPRYDQYTEQVNQEIDQFERDATGWGTAGRFAGQVLPTVAIPGGVGGGITRRVASGAAAGGLTGGVMFNPSGTIEDKIYQAGVGGLGGGIAGALTPLLPTLLKYGSKKLKDWLGKGTDTPPPADVAEEIQRLGFEGDTAPTYAQRTRNPNDWTDEMQLMKADPDGRIRDRYAAQNDQFRQIKDDKITSMPGQSDDAEAAADTLFKDVMKQWEDEQAQVSLAYEKARVKAPNASTKLDNLKGRIDDLVESGEGDLTPHVEATRKLLSSRGMDAEGNLIDLDMGQVENIRKTLIKRSKNAKDPTDRYIIGQLKDSLDDDIASAGDVFADARKMASDRFDKFDGDTISKIAAGRGVSRTFVKNKIINGDVKDIRDIKKVSSPQEWENVRAQVYEYFMDKAYQGNSQSLSGEFSGKMLAKHLKGKNRILKEIFSDDEILHLKDMAKTGEQFASDPAKASVNHSNTASGVLNYVDRLGKYTGEIGRRFSDFRKAIANKQAVDAALGGYPPPPPPQMSPAPGYMGGTPRRLQRSTAVNAYQPSVSPDQRRLQMSPVDVVPDPVGDLFRSVGISPERPVTHRGTSNVGTSTSGH